MRGDFFCYSIFCIHASPPLMHNSFPFTFTSSSPSTPLKVKFHLLSSSSPTLSIYIECPLPHLVFRLPSSESALNVLKPLYSPHPRTPSVTSSLSRVSISHPIHLLTPSNTRSLFLPPFFLFLIFIPFISLLRYIFSFLFYSFTSSHK